jgi:hypothetical protein
MNLKSNQGKSDPMYLYTIQYAYKATEFMFAN